MIKLLVPAMIGGRLLQAGTVTVAPEELEKRLISAGNAERAPAVEKEWAPAAAGKVPDKNAADSAKPDALAGKEQVADGKDLDDADLKLGRGGVQSK